MISKNESLGISDDGRYRVIPETQIVEMIRLIGCVYESEREGRETVREAIQTWVRLGLNFNRAANGECFFDPAEIYNFIKRVDLDGLDDFWTERCIRTGRRLVSDPAGIVAPGLSAEGERRFAVDFKRTFNLRSVAPGSRLRLRMPLPLVGDYLSDLQVTPLFETAQSAQISPGRLEVRLTASGQDEVTIGAKLDFTGRLQEPRSGQGGAEPDRELYLRHREGLIVVSERVSDLGRSLAATDAAPLEAVRAFWDYLNRTLMCGALHYEDIDAASPCDWALDSGWYDCQLGAALLAALCRARGIPARILGGHLLHRMAPGLHYWAEVWIEDQGWTPFDFLSWDLSRGNRDRDWSDYFFGRLDFRLTTHRLPRDFTGALGVPTPSTWLLLPVSVPGGEKIHFTDGSGTLIYADTILVDGPSKE